MTTTASKLFFGGAVAALLSAWVYGWGTGGGLTGVMLLGFKGGVGELMGYTVLVAVSAVLAGTGVATSVLRDADPEVQAALVRLDAPPAVPAPAGASYWPALGAVATVVTMVGLVASPVLFVMGAILLLAVTLEWMVTAWSERATGDPAVNRQIRSRLMYPVEVPLAGVLAIGVLVVAVSRVFLTLDKNSTSLIAVVIGAVILAAGFMIAYRPHLPKDAVAAIVIVGALVALAAGIAAAAAGSRSIEPHEEEHSGAPLVGPLGTSLDAPPDASLDLSELTQ